MADSLDIGAPATVVGRWLLASLLFQSELAAQLGRALNGGERGWNDDEPAVMQAASEVMCRRNFSRDESPSAISLFVLSLRTRAEEIQLNQKSLEQVIVNDLGGAADLSGLNARDIFELRSYVILQACQGLHYDKVELEGLVLEAEGRAFARGFRPPLAR